MTTCVFCKQELVDGAEESGWTGIGPDWMTPEGDFGCDSAPETNHEGVGGHRTEHELREVYRLVSLSENKVFYDMRENLYSGDIK